MTFSHLRCVGLALLCLSVPAAISASDPADELPVRAALVYNLAKFVQWPDDATDSQTLHLCVYGEEDLYRVFSRLQGREVYTRSIAVRWVDPRNVNSESCDILYVDNDLDERPDSLHELRRSPILTMGETREFAENTGVVALVLHRNRVRFVVNRRAAEQRGLRLSSQLLAVSDVVGELRVSEASPL